MATIVHFDLPADDTRRAMAFYRELFGWKFEKSGGPYDDSLIETAALDGSPGIGGGLGKRGDPGQRSMNYVGVADLDATLAQVEALGGSITMPRTAVPGFGFLAVCTDTEGNPFGVWEEEAEGV
ncbi:MAG: VOC family protein [Methanomicrobiaceae archaeon]|nr:VOC family protein [Methanomicrobiaceae archaeon]